MTPIIAPVEYPQLERASDLSFRDFRAYKRSRQPIVLNNVMAKWNALGWTWDTLRSRYGSTEVTVSRYEAGWYKASDARQMPLREFIDGMLGRDWESFPYYIRDSWDLFSKHSEMINDCPVPEHFFDWSPRLGVSRPGPRL